MNFSQALYNNSTTVKTTVITTTTTFASTERTGDKANADFADNLFSVLSPVGSQSHYQNKMREKNAGRFTLADMVSALQALNWKDLSKCGKPTSEAELDINLSAKENASKGGSATYTLPTDPKNDRLRPEDLIVPSSVNNLKRGDKIEVRLDNGPQSGGVIRTFVYGGFSEGRSVTTGQGGDSTAPRPANREFAGNILDANNVTTPFLVNGTQDFAQDALKFFISDGESAYQFQYTSGSPNAAAGQFNTLTNLAQAINAKPGLNARIADDKLYVGSDTGRVQFTNGNAEGGQDGDYSYKGIDWVDELGLANNFNDNEIIAIWPTFNTLAELERKVDGMKTLFTEEPEQVADMSIKNGKLNITLNDPTKRLSFSDVQGNQGSLLAMLGMITQNATIQATYDGLSSWHTMGPDGRPIIRGMAAGTVKPDYRQTVEIYDSKGKAHNIEVGFLKIGEDKWAVEVYTKDPYDLGSMHNMPNVDQFANGIIEFNDDGSLKSISPSLEKELKINWRNGTSNEVTIDFGSIGKKNGITQKGGQYRTLAVKQDGSVGHMIGIGLNDRGQIIAGYSNGQSRVILDPRDIDSSLRGGKKIASDMMSVLLNMQAVA